MSEQKAHDIMDDLGKTRLSAHPERLISTFEALATLDAHRVEQRARQVLDTLDADVLDDGGMGALGLLHEARLAVFRASVLDVLGDKCPEVESALERDIPTWIEANAPRVAHANLRLMEAELGDTDPQAHRSLIELDHWLDPKRCEAEQTRLLLMVWWEIETALQARFRLSGTD